MSTPKVRPSFTFTEDRLAQLKAIVPEAFPDGQLDWDTLYESLGGALPDEDAGQEHFGLNWPGKREARRLAAKPSHGTLRLAPGEGVNEDTTHNLFIEGDNLEVLKVLQKSYAGRIKMIYIDPPYNTGKDFVYQDNYSEPLTEYLKRSGQANEAGDLLTTNAKGSGRFHSRWLNMIYPRLVIARQLLRDDGVIFVSIDENEIHNLKTLMNEVFGEENFISCIANISNPKGRSDDKYIAPAHEYVLVYKPGEFSRLRGWNPEDNVLRRYNKIDSKGVKYREIDLRKTGDNDRREDRPNLFYYFHYNESTNHLVASKEEIAPEGYISIRPVRADGVDGRWRWELKNSNENINLLIPKIMPTRQMWSVFEKDELTSDKQVKPTTAWTHKEVNSERGSEQFISLGFNKEIFLNPKPVGLIKMMLTLVTDSTEGDIVLDFFAGSASTAQAVLELNREDNGNRQFILVQIPEPTQPDSDARKAGFKVISEISKERIRRAIMNPQIITKPKSATIQASFLEESDEPSQAAQEDLGFLVYKLATSNLKSWKDYEGNDLAAIRNLFSDHESPLVEGWTPEAVLDEIILLEGFPLDSDVDGLAQFSQNAVQCVSSPMCGHRLWVCLDEKLHSATTEGLETALTGDDILICLDTALDDNIKLRLTQLGKLKTI